MTTSSTTTTMTTTSLPSIGQSVRVRLPAPVSPASSCQLLRCCRATVSYVNAEERTVDVVFEDGVEWAGGLEEESYVPLERVLPLQAFEHQQSEQQQQSEEEEKDNDGQGLAAAAMVREEGNALFRLGDYGAALDRYRLALRRLLLLLGGKEEEEEEGGGGEGGCCGSLRIGATVLVHASPADDDTHAQSTSSKRAGRLLVRVRRATVADVDRGGKNLDVIFDDDDDEEDGVSMSRVVPLASSPPAQMEEGRLLLNLSRMYLKSPLGRLHEALRSVAMAVAVLEVVLLSNEDETEQEGRDAEEGERLLLSAFQVQVGALCRGGFFSAARDVVSRLAPLIRRGEETASRLGQEIEAAATQRQRDHKRLVKDMSRWLNRAMEEGKASGVE